MSDEQRKSAAEDGKKIQAARDTMLANLKKTRGQLKAQQAAIAAAKRLEQERINAASIQR